MLDELLIETPFTSRRRPMPTAMSCASILLRVPEDDESNSLRRCVSSNRRSCCSHCRSGYRWYATGD
ncbi:hypothetical protein ACLK19_20365 [Escherichia coli]